MIKSLIALQIDILLSLPLFVGLGDAGAEWEWVDDKSRSPVAVDFPFDEDGNSNPLIPFFPVALFGAEAKVNSPLAALFTSTFPTKFLRLLAPACVVFGVESVTILLVLVSGVLLSSSSSSMQSSPKSVIVVRMKEPEFVYSTGLSQSNDLHSGDCVSLPLSQGKRTIDFSDDLRFPIFSDNGKLGITRSVLIDSRRLPLEPCIRSLGSIGMTQADAERALKVGSITEKFSYFIYLIYSKFRLLSRPNSSKKYKYSTFPTKWKNEHFVYVKKTNCILCYFFSTSHVIWYIRKCNEN